jgi:hypothetical protein
VFLFVQRNDVSGSRGSGGDSSSGSLRPHYDALVSAGREAVLRTFEEAGIVGVRESIVDEMVITPPEWKERCVRVFTCACRMHGYVCACVFAWMTGVIFTWFT